MDIPFQFSHLTQISVLLVTPKNVARIIHSLDASKATGSDGIPVVVLQRCFAELAPILAKLYNMCLADSVFPSLWKVASVVSAFKGVDEHSLATNYRPINLIPVICMIFECFINHKLLSHLEENELLTDCQCGIQVDWQLSLLNY